MIYQLVLILHFGTALQTEVVAGQGFRSWGDCIVRGIGTLRDDKYRASPTGVRCEPQEVRV